jgi:hypothetical protein
LLPKEDPNRWCRSLSNLKSIFCWTWNPIYGRQSSEQWYTEKNGNFL